MRDGFQRWCEGVPQIGERQLSAHEITHFARLLIVSQRAARHYRWFASISGVAMLASWAYFAMTLEHTGRYAAGTAIAAVGAAILAAGVCGALGEVLFGFDRRSRRLFLAAGAGVGLAALLDLPASVASTVGAVAAIVMVFGGAAMLALRSRDLRKSTALARALEQDLAQGRCWQFIDAPAPDADDDAGAAAAPPPRAIDLLPLSHIEVRTDTARADRLAAHPVSELGTPVAPPPDAPAAMFEAPDAGNAFELRQRHLQPAERLELTQHIARLKWTILKQGLGTAYVVAAVSRLVDRALGGHNAAIPLRPSIVILAVLAVTLQVLALVRHRRAMQRDADEGMVLILRRAPGEERPPVTQEILAISRTPWTQFGHPAWWRSEPRARSTALWPG